MWVPVGDHNKNWTFECSRRSPMQVKFAIKEGYNHNSIVTSLIAKKLKGNVNRNAKKQIWTNDVRKSSSQREIWIKYNFMFTVAIRQSHQARNLKLCKWYKRHVITSVTRKSYICYMIPMSYDLFYALNPYLVILSFVYNNHVLTCYRHRIQASGTNNCNMQN